MKSSKILKTSEEIIEKKFVHTSELNGTKREDLFS
jgi:hypothetical protein